MVRRLGFAVVVGLGLALGLGSASADPPAQSVALLPLDASAHLEIYGQPVASEIARELVAGGIDVVVVGPKMAVPAKARLVVDGTITPGKGEAVVLSVRIRDRASGAVLDKLESTAPELTKIDGAATDLASRILPSVRGRLAAPEPQEGATLEHHAAPPHPTALAPAPTLDIRLVARPGVTTPLDRALADELAAWAGHHHWQAVPAAARGDAHVALTVLAFDVTRGAVPMSRARVRVRIEDAAHGKLFDRVVVTDTVVGDKDLALDQLAARTARAVLDIVEPHMRRAVPAWR